MCVRIELYLSISTLYNVYHRGQDIGRSHNVVSLFIQVLPVLSEIFKYHNSLLTECIRLFELIIAQLTIKF